MDTVIMDAEAMRKVENQLASQIMDSHPYMTELVIVGIQRRGADLASRLAKKLSEHGQTPELGSLDINLYRDDWTSPDGIPCIGTSKMPQSISGKTILLVDDVLYTGRTIRAALEAVLDYGRPSRVELMVLVDRGGRELPIAATYAGKFVQACPNCQIDVLTEERDGQDCVILRNNK